MCLQANTTKQAISTKNYSTSADKSEDSDSKQKDPSDNSNLNNLNADQQQQENNLINLKNNYGKEPNLNSNNNNNNKQNFYYHNNPNLFANKGLGYEGLNLFHIPS